MFYKVNAGLRLGGTTPTPPTEVNLRVKPLLLMTEGLVHLFLVLKAVVVVWGSWIEDRSFVLKEYSVIYKS